MMRLIVWQRRSGHLHPKYLSSQRGSENMMRGMPARSCADRQACAHTHTTDKHGRQACTHTRRQEIADETVKTDFIIYIIGLSNGTAMMK